MTADMAGRVALVALLGVALLPAAASAQFTREHDITSLRGFHGDTGRIRRSFESDDEARSIFRQVLAAAGLAGIEDRILIRASAETPNALAGMEPGGTRYIFYNAVFIKEIAARSNSYWSLVAILAHEVGHHVRFHTVTEGRDHEFELEADYQAGFILRRMGATLDDAQAVYRTFPDAATRTHPGRDQRLQSVTLGWSAGGSASPSPPSGANPVPASQTDNRGCFSGQVRRVDGSCVTKDPSSPLPRSSGAAPLSRSEEAAISPLQTFRECNECPELVAVPPGVIENSTEPSHRIRIGRRLAVAKYEVTLAQWDACALDGGCAYVPDDSGWGRGDRPATKVSWDDVKTAYLPWLSRKTGKRYRLLTEAEWRYVAAAGSTSSYSWGDDFIRGQANCAGCGSPWDNKQSAPVGSFPPNAFGLFDVHGNVWEWVEDCVAPNYPRMPSDGSAAMGDASCFKGLRGGSWDNDTGILQLTSRGRNRRNLRSHSVGFRVARSLE
jgi:formylglycine-generating enzyme required for sulfatase activity